MPSHGPQFRPQEVQRLRHYFANYDINNDGYLDELEFDALLREAFPRSDKKMRREMMPKQIEDKTKINFQEYIAFMSEDMKLQFHTRFVRDQRSKWEDKCGLIMYIVFLIFYIVFLVSEVRGSYWVSSSVVRHLEEDHFQNADDLRYKKVYADVGEVEEYWQWQLWPMINTIWGKNDPAARGYSAINKVNFPIGALKITQYRVGGETCGSHIDRLLQHNAESTGMSAAAIAARKKEFRTLCYPEYTTDTADTAPWLAQVSTTGTQVRLSPEHVQSDFDRQYVYPAYTHRTAEELHASRLSNFFGKVTTYVGGDGYAVVLPFSYNRSMVVKILTVLEQGMQVGGWVDPDANSSTQATSSHPVKPLPWVDQGTRGIKVEFYTYNQNADLMARFQNFIEVTASGQIVPLHYVYSFAFFDITKHSAVYFIGVAIFCGMIFGRLIFWFFDVIHLTKLRVKQSGYSGFVQHIIEGTIVVFRDVWTPLEFVNLAMFCGAWSLRFYIMARAFTKTSVLSMDHYPELYDRIAELHTILYVLDSINALLTALRIFYYLRLSQQLNMLTATIDQAKYDLLAICFIFMVVIVGFSVTSHIALGTHMEGYRNIVSTIASLLRMLLGDFDYESMKMERQVFAPILFVAFQLVASVVVLNLVIAVLSSAYSTLRKGKYQPGSLNVLLERLDRHDRDAVFNQKFIDQISRREKGLQNVIRGKAFWRELVYHTQMAILYMTSKDDLDGNEAEWNRRYSEIRDYNPRTFWREQEAKLVFAKRSLAFTDRLLATPKSLKHHLYDEFGVDLPLAVNLRPNAWVAGTDLTKHDLVRSPAYHLSLHPRTVLVDLMDYFHRWKTKNASTYVRIEDGELEEEVGRCGTVGLALRGSEDAEEMIEEDVNRWEAKWMGLTGHPTADDDKRSAVDGRSSPSHAGSFGVGLDKTDSEETEMKDRLLRYFETLRLDAQQHHMNRLQRALDDLHTPIAGTMTDGSFKITASDVHIPTTLTFSGVPVTSIDANGVYLLKGHLNGRPYWKKRDQEDHEPKLYVLWGDGGWWVGSPRRDVYGRLCDPAVMWWQDSSFQMPPKGSVPQPTATAARLAQAGSEGTAAAAAAAASGTPDSPTEIQVGNAAIEDHSSRSTTHPWETVIDGGHGGIGEPPVLRYTAVGGGKVLYIDVRNASSQEANGRYLLQTFEENGKRVWRKRYQKVRRRFKVAPPPDEKEVGVNRMRSDLRDIRDDIAKRFNVTLRVPAEAAADDRPMEMEGDWDVVCLAYEAVMETARKVDIKRYGQQHKDWKILPEVFFDRNGNPRPDDVCDMLAERYHKIKGRVEGYTHHKQIAVYCQKEPEELRRWERVGNGFDLDITWKGGRWTIEKRIQKSKQSYVGFHDKPAYVSVLLFVRRQDSWMDDKSSVSSAMSQQNPLEKYMKEKLTKILADLKRPARQPVSCVPCVPPPNATEATIGDLHFFDRYVAWGSSDAAVFRIGFEDAFAPKRDVLFRADNGEWVRGRMERRQGEGANAKYEVVKKMRTDKGTDTKKFSNLTRGQWRGLPGEDADAWAAHFVDYVNNQQGGPDLLGASKVLTPSPQILYCWNDPDTQYHPPLFEGVSWQLATGGRSTDVKLVGSTNAYIKKAGLGGLDRRPLYLGLHHAYTKINYRVLSQVTVYRPPPAYLPDTAGQSGDGEADSSSDMPVAVASLDTDSVICGAVITFVPGKGPGAADGAEGGKQYVELFRGQSGERRGYWVENTRALEAFPHDQQKWTTDRRDEHTMYPCCHEWRNEATLWVLQRAPRRGTHFYITKPALYATAGEASRRLGDTMAATNYPLSYKGDEKTRYLTLTDVDSLSPDIRDSYCRVGAEERVSGKDPFMWRFHHYPKAPEDPRDGKTWWQSDQCILDWMRHDKNRVIDAKTIEDGDFNPVGMKWSSRSRSMLTANVWQPAGPKDLIQRLEWYYDHWRVVRRSFEEYDFDDEDDKNTFYSKSDKLKRQELQAIDQELSRDNHRLLIRSSEANPPSGASSPGGGEGGAFRLKGLGLGSASPVSGGGDLSAHLSLWRNFPDSDFFGVWETRAFLYTSGAEYYRILPAQNGIGIEGCLIDGEKDICMGDLAFEFSNCPDVTAEGANHGKLVFHENSLDAILRAISYDELHIEVVDWDRKGIESRFILFRKDRFKRDRHSYFPLATQGPEYFTHSTWEIEPVHDLGNTIDSAVEGAVAAHEQYGVQEGFRQLIRDEMHYMLEAIIPGVLSEELGSGQLAQTLNYKIHSEAVDREDRRSRGITEADQRKLVKHMHEVTRKNTLKIFSMADPLEKSDNQVVRDLYSSKSLMNFKDMARTGALLQLPGLAEFDSDSDSYLDDGMEGSGLSTAGAVDMQPNESFRKRHAKIAEANHALAASGSSTAPPPMEPSLLRRGSSLRRQNSLRRNSSLRRLASLRRESSMNSQPAAPPPKLNMEKLNLSMSGSGNPVLPPASSEPTGGKAGSVGKLKLPLAGVASAAAAAEVEQAMASPRGNVADPPPLGTPFIGSIESVVSTESPRPHVATQGSSSSSTSLLVGKPEAEASRASGTGQPRVVSDSESTISSGASGVGSDEEGSGGDAAEAAAAAAAAAGAAQQGPAQARPAIPSLGGSMPHPLLPKS